ncbi:MAG: hypothetical protein FJY95_11120 [Candidatus Handelsmanbacteria bacterium]|nr:hypothetical protein [Candidatus Handelsmanbacteria bacterium]
MHTDHRWNGIAAAFVSEHGPRIPLPGLARVVPEALRNEELRARILGTGYRGRNVLELARAILEAHPASELMCMYLAALAHLNWLGRARAAKLVAAIELVKRGLQRGLGVLPLISSPREAVPLLAEIKDQRRDYFLCL